jgi:DNA helicase II / ATP-dependent DNA helicase PcrA
VNTLTSKRKLNKEQLEGIKHKKGPLLIIAGAGTGKTTVITERIKYLILGKLAKPEEILALTFTEKAAREMEERVDIEMPYGYTQMWISTFHSFCDRVLRQEALHIGLDPRYKLMTDADAVALVRKNLFKFDLDYFRPLGNPNKFILGMLQHFSRLQDEDVLPGDYIDWVKKQKDKLKEKKALPEEKEEVVKWIELSRAYKTYEEIKIREGLFDYGDLITKTLKLFRLRKNILKEYQKRFKYFLVDEFQDTNFAQNELVKLLAGKEKNITVVGDDDQAVYRFRGASVSNIVQFRKSFPKTRVVVLNKNYRSTQEILDKAYGLIQHNNPDRLEVVEKINKKLISQINKDGEKVSFLHLDRVENEAEEVVKKIKELSHGDEVYEYKDFAILVRANNHADPFVRALGRHGIPHQFLGPSRLFTRPEIIDLISFLKVLCDPEDSVSFFRLLSIEHFDILSRDLVMLGSFARRLNLSIFEACEKLSEVRISNGSKEKIEGIIKIIEKYLKQVRKDTAGQLLYFFLEETGLLKKLLSPDTAESERVTQNISKFFDKLKNYEVSHEDATVPAVVDWIGLSMELGESPLATDTDWTNVNAVNILTIHSAKGLEFPVVFIVNLVAQRFPSMDRREQIPIPEKLIKEVLPVGDYHLEEERRLFYVGATRAKEKLFLTAADYYGEGKREKKLSPFIFETLGDEMTGLEKSVNLKQLSFLEYGNTKKKEKYTKEKIKIDYLSYSQIETFKICPLHYKLRYIYKIPTPPTPALSFGSSMHLTLKDFYLAVKAGEKPTESLINSILVKNWINEGYMTSSHREEMMKKGKRYLSDFLKKEFDPKVIPIMLEQSFIVPIDSKRPLRIGGKIDRVDVLPDGRIEIIDYKTGAKVPTQKEIDKDIQMTFYALAATNIPGSPFGKEAKDLKLSFYYFENGEKISTVRTKEDLEKAKEEILDYREEIEKSDYKCSGNIFCRSCEYKIFCEDGNN